jgi:hypothetical protein
MVDVYLRMYVCTCIFWCGHFRHLDVYVEIGFWQNNVARTPRCRKLIKISNSTEPYWQPLVGVSSSPHSGVSFCKFWGTYLQNLKDSSENFLSSFCDVPYDLGSMLWSQCLAFLPIFGKIWLFLQNQCYDQIFAKIVVVWAKKNRQYFR